MTFADSPVRDLNMDVAGQLRDLAMVHSSRHASIAYKRAAQAVIALPMPLDQYVAQHALRDLHHIGPASERVILECLEHRRSPTVERAIEASGRRAEVEAAWRFRSNFLSRAGVFAILKTSLPGVVGRDDYRGDLQMHSEWSDGSDSIVALADAAIERGYQYIGISDHSHGLPIAGGISMEEVKAQHEEIDRLNGRSRRGFRVVKAIEANIPVDGGIDLTSAEAASFEIVLAAPHSKLRRPEDQTARMLATVRDPRVHVLAHPRGRMYNRQGVLANWQEVFAEAARCGVAIELDGDPYRQDLDFGLAKLANDAGCLFAIDSDAHSGVELAYSEFALAHARHAGIATERVINTWPVEQLLEWAARRSRAA